VYLAAFLGRNIIGATAAAQVL